MINALDDADCDPLPVVQHRLHRLSVRGTLILWLQQILDRAIRIVKRRDSLHADFQMLIKPAPEQQVGCLLLLGSTQNNSD